MAIYLRIKASGCEAAYELTWQRADAIARELKTPRIDMLGVLKVVRLDLPQKTFLLPTKLAAELGKSLTAKAREAEQLQEAEKTIHDAAILIRAGADFGLAPGPKMLAEAVKEAQSNSTLRRFMPGGIKSKAVFGAPSVIVHPPPIQAPKE